MFTYHVVDHLTSQTLPDSHATYDEAQAVADTLACANVERLWDGRAVQSVAYTPGKAPVVGAIVDVLGAQWEVVSLRDGHHLGDSDRHLKSTWATLAAVQ